MYTSADDSSGTSLTLTTPRQQLGSFGERVALQHLEANGYRVLNYQVARAVERGWPLHPDAVAARNELALR